MRNLFVGAALAAALSAGAASASTINVSRQADLFGPGELRQTVKVVSPVRTQTVWAGMFHMTGDQGVGDFMAFCVDLAQALGNPGQVVEEQPLLFSQGIRDNIDKLFSSVIGDSTMGAVIDTSLKAAGFQVALWEIVYETSGTFDAGVGDFWIYGNAEAKAQANTYLSGLTGAPMGKQDLTYYFSDSNQDLVTGEPAPDPVPVPAAGLLIMTGLGALAALRRRRKAA